MRSLLLSALTLVALGTVTSLVSGCAADSSDDAEAGDVGELNKSVLAHVGAFRFDGGQTVAAPQKIKTLLSAMSRAKEGKLRCLPLPGTEPTTLLAESGETMATLTAVCGVGAGGKAEAQLEVTMTDGRADQPLAEPRSYVVQLDTAAFDDVRKAPAAVGDLLFGVDKIVLGPIGVEATTTTVAEDIRRVTTALGADQVPVDGMASRCLPELSATFFAGKKQIALITTCSTEGAITLAGSNARAAIRKVDIDALKAVYARKGTSAQ